MSSWARSGEDFGQPGRRRWPLISTTLIALALLVGFVLGRVLDNPPVQVRTVPLPPGSARVEAGVPVGYQHTQQGAVDAATGYAVTLNGPLLLDPGALKAGETYIATPDYRQELYSQTDKALQALNSAYGVQSNAGAGATPAVRLVPIAYKLESYSPSEARVSIWAVWLIAEQGILPAQQAWITTQFSLRWLDGDWKLAASGSHPGPVPQPPQGVVPEQSQPLPPPLTAEYTEYKHVGS